MANNILEKIKKYKLKEIEELKACKSLQVLESIARNSKATKGFKKNLNSSQKVGFGLVAEIKKASPSKGLIRPNFDIKKIIEAYQLGGASCLSVLTDNPSFQGSAENLLITSEISYLPILRKDFMYDPYQVVESRALGADCILIILASVSDAQAIELEQTALEWNMDVLLEVHSQAELERALNLKSSLIGINNRNLNNFITNLSTTEELAKNIPNEYLIISESGFQSHLDLKRIENTGVKCFLIGETLMRQTDLERATREILGINIL